MIEIFTKFSYIDYLNPFLNHGNIYYVLFTKTQYKFCGPNETSHMKTFLAECAQTQLSQKKSKNSAQITLFAYMIWKDCAVLMQE